MMKRDEDIKPDGETDKKDIGPHHRRGPCDDGQAWRPWIGVGRVRPYYEEKASNSNIANRKYPDYLMSKVGL